jgi:glyoxylase-like metal-dependent hydrolase (beta-lactamase superfamily II)
LKEERALFSGDHVMGWSTSVVAPPDGDMAAYMRSLEKLLLRDEQIYWPTHGGPIREPKPFVSALLRHRRSRETEILSALENGCHQIPDIVRRIYSGLDPRLIRAAELNVLAHLLKLIQEARVIAEGEGLKADYTISP